jgi:chloramphenicol 3-O phosphotransferase
MSGTIIILNGPSASGKSSIQKELQKKFNQLYLRVGIDTFFDALIAEPDLSEFSIKKEFSQHSPNGELIRKVQLLTEGGFSIVPLIIGTAGQKIIQGMHEAIKAYANRGNNLIVDYILYHESWRKDLIQTLEENKVYLVGIQAPLAIIEKREKNRGTSPVGHARSHYATVHQGMTYDLEIDASQETPEQIAQKIYSFIENNPNPQAKNSMIKELSHV